MDKNVEFKDVQIDEIEQNDGQIEGLGVNPRFIREEKFLKLVESIRSFPEMLKLRPIVVDENMVVLGGNMRLKASIEAGLTSIPIVKVSNLTPAKKKEFIIKDNVGFGQWDWDLLSSEWDDKELEEWGMDVFSASDVDLDEFFEDNNTEKEVKNKIVLEYSEEDFEIINDKLNSMDGSKENIIWELIVGKE